MNDISQVMQLDPKTLRKHFAEELEIGRAKAELQVRKTVYEMAVVDRLFPAVRWWTQTQLGWAAPSKVESIKDFEKLTEVQQDYFFPKTGLY